MAVGYQKVGNDLDNILAAYVSGDPHAPMTGYELLATDFAQRYSKLSRGTAPATTGYEVAGADLNTIFAAKGTVLQALTLVPQGVGSSTLSTASKLLTTSPAGNVTANTAVRVNTLGWGELDGLFRSTAWPSSGSIGSPSGHGMLWDVTTLEGTSIAAGTWNLDIVVQALDSSDPPGTTVFICDFHFRAWKRSSGGVYTSIGDGVVTNHGVINSGSTFVSVNASFSGGATSFGTGDKLYVDAWADITTNLTSPPLASSLQMVYSSGGSPLATIATPGYVIA